MFRLKLRVAIQWVGPLAVYRPVAAKVFAPVGSRSSSLPVCLAVICHREQT